VIQVRGNWEWRWLWSIREIPSLHAPNKFSLRARGHLSQNLEVAIPIWRKGAIANCKKI